VILSNSPDGREHISRPQTPDAFGSDDRDVLGFVHALAKSRSATPTGSAVKRRNLRLFPEPVKWPCKSLSIIFILETCENGVESPKDCTFDTIFSYDRNSNDQSLSD
jgi:hypothetical protein